MKPYLLLANCSPYNHRAVTVAEFEECFVSPEILYGHSDWVSMGCDAQLVHYGDDLESDPVTAKGSITVQQLAGRMPVHRSFEQCTCGASGKPLARPGRTW
jgi:hypothetical protein